MRERLEEVDNLNSAALFLNLIRNKCELKLNTEQRSRALRMNKLDWYSIQRQALTFHEHLNFPFFLSMAKKWLFPFNFNHSSSTFLCTKSKLGLSVIVSRCSICSWKGINIWNGVSPTNPPKNIHTKQIHHKKYRSHNINKQSKLTSKAHIAAYS